MIAWMKCSVLSLKISDIGGTRHADEIPHQTPNLVVQLCTFLQCVQISKCHVYQHQMISIQRLLCISGSILVTTPCRIFSVGLLDFSQYDSMRLSTQPKLSEK